MSRLDDRHRIAPAVQLALADPLSAGLFIDQRNGGRPVFLFKGAVAGREAQLRPLIPSDIDFELRSVERSVQDLEQLRERVLSADAELAGRGIEITLTGIKPSANVLVIGVRDLTRDKEEVLLSRFGSGIVVRDQDPGVADACVNFVNCPPPKGGIRMTWSTSTTRYCTTGFVVERAGGTTKYVVTAGHCFVANGGTDGDDWKHNGAKIGDARTHTWANGADADVGLLQLTSIPDDRNLILATEPSTVINVISVRVPIEQAEGDAVCRMGATWGRDCGTITLWRTTNPSCFGNPAQCRQIDMTNEVSFDSTGGDSGGPIYQYYRSCSHCALEAVAYGTHVHSEPDTVGAIGWYSPIGHGYVAHSAKYGWTYGVCTTSAC